MIISKITVHSSIGFNHPHERFANFKLGVSLEAGVDPVSAVPSDDPEHVVHCLQLRAQVMLETEKARLLDFCDAVQERERREDQINDERNRLESYRIDLRNECEVECALAGIKRAKAELAKLGVAVEDDPIDAGPAPAAEGLCPRDDSPCESAGDGSHCCGEGESR